MSRYFQLLISEEFVERTIPEDDSVRLLDQIVDELDLHSLACSYSRMGRKSATSPRTLLKIMIYANMYKFQYKKCHILSNKYAQHLSVFMEDV